MVVDQYGPLLDREWVVVDEENHFLTQRTDPILARVKPSVFFDRLEVSFSEQKAVSSFPLDAVDNSSEIIHVFEHAIKATPESREVHQFFSDLLKKRVRLMRYLREPQRKVSLDNDASTYTRMTDQFPFHVIHDSLVQELKSVDPSISNEVFRANIVLRGTQFEKPEDEELISSLKIGGLKLIHGQPTSRCVITTLNPQTGEKRGPEPLKTLAQTRKRGNRVYFGMHYVHQFPRQNEGDQVEIKVGDSGVRI